MREKLIQILGQPDDAEIADCLLSTLRYENRKHLDVECRISEIEGLNRSHKYPEKYSPLTLTLRG